MGVIGPLAAALALSGSLTAFIASPSAARADDRGRDLSSKERRVVRLEVKDALRLEREALAPADPLSSRALFPSVAACGDATVERLKCGLTIAVHSSDRNDWGSRATSEFRVKPTFTDGSVGISAALTF